MPFLIISETNLQSPYFFKNTVILSPVRPIDSLAFKRRLVLVVETRGRGDKGQALSIAYLKFELVANFFEL